MRIPRGANINETIEEFCRKESSKGGYFIGIGAVESATLAHYSVVDKKYTDKKFKEPLELTNLVGNVCFSEDKIIVHSHATFANQELKSISGHLIEARVSGACEIIFFPFDQRIKKNYDEETGLKLMDF